MEMESPPTQKKKEIKIMLNQMAIFFNKHRRTTQNKHNFANKFENLAIKVSFLERI